MKPSLFAIAFFLATFFFNSANAQDDPSKELSPTALNAQKRENDGMLSNIKRNPATPVKDQSKTGTCWSFSTTSLVESQVIKNRFGPDGMTFPARMNAGCGDIRIYSEHSAEGVALMNEMKTEENVLTKLKSRWNQHGGGSADDSADY